jgi:hypothetical protein
MKNRFAQKLVATEESQIQNKYQKTIQILGLNKKATGNPKLATDTLKLFDYEIKDLKLNLLKLQNKPIPKHRHEPTQQ